jgi:hypothetical protein
MRTDLDPAAVAVIEAFAEKRVAELQEARRAAIEAEIAGNPCCNEYNADGLHLARERGYEWEPAVCPQHREWQRISWMLNNGVRGMSRGEVEEA